jgi:LCP family protein required for cell wall assembly
VAASRSLPRALAGRFVVALTLALALVVGGLITVNVIIDRKINSIERVELRTAPDTDPGEPANFLLIGSDTRSFVADAPDAEQFCEDNCDTSQRSDTIMVVHVDPEAQKGFLVSFPRDLMVDIPGVGDSKINAAFNSGAQTVIDTLQSNYQIPIHHYLEVDFESFRGIVDAMGGVSVYLAAPARDEVSLFEIPALYGFRPGCYVLDGKNALGYVRSRNYEEFIDYEWVETGQDAPDLHRIERQQAFMRRLAIEAVQKSISDPLAANDIADEAIVKLKADAGLTRSDINKLIQAFRSVDPTDEESIVMTTLPTIAGPRNTGLGDILVPREPDADAVFASLRDFGPIPSDDDGPRPSSIRVRVFNGSGVAQAAANTSAALLEQGFPPAGIGNNPGGNIATTQIRYRPGSEDMAEVVQRYVGGVGRLVEDGAIVDADVTLVLGRDFTGVTPPAGATPAPPESAAAPSPGSVTPPPPANGEPAPDPTDCS